MATDLLYFKYAPILVMLFRWYSVSQFYDNKMEITLWYEENGEPIRFFYFGTAQIVRGVENTALICSRSQRNTHHVRLYRYHKQYVLL